MTPTVLSTRPEGDRDALVTALRAAGLHCLAVPTVATVAVGGTDLLEALACLPDGGWVGVTSRAGARAALDALRDAGRSPADLRWASVGSATTSTLAGAGVRVEVEAADSGGAALGHAIEPGRDLSGIQLVLPRSDLASADLTTVLRRRGATVYDVVAYRTIEGPPANLLSLRRALSQPDLAAIVFASGSAVRGLVALAGDAAAAALGRTALVSIGPSTSRVLRGLGMEVAAEAAAPTVSGLVEAVLATIPAPLRDRERS